MTSTPPDRLASDGANIRVFLAYGVFTDLGTRLASPQVVMPWVYALIGGPLFLFGLLIPSVRLGAIASQVAAVPILEAMTYRKWLTTAASLMIAGLLALVCLTVYVMPDLMGTIVFFLCMLGFGACNGAIQLTSQDVMAKTIAHKRIAGLLAIQSSVGGILTLVIAGSYIAIDPEHGSPNRHMIMIVIAAAIWAVAGMTFALVKEAPGSVRPRQSFMSEVRKSRGLYAANEWFRRYTVARILLLSVGLATPFYSIHAATLYENADHSLSIFIIAVGAANIVSGIFWRPLLRRDPRWVLALACVIAGAGGGVAISHAFLPEVKVPYLYAVVLALLALSEQGLTQASKTYIALIAPNDERPLYIAANNFLLGILAVGISGGLGVLAHMTHILWALGVLVAITLCAGVYALFMVPPPQE